MNYQVSEIRGFQTMILDRYAQNGRDLPRRHTTDPYAILVSEIMSQQTQVSRVIPKWQQWIADFPTVESLAGAALAEVLTHWSGLGYNRRAKALWEAAKQITLDVQNGHVVACAAFGHGSAPSSPAKISRKRGGGGATLGSVAAGGDRAGESEAMRRDAVDYSAFGATPGELYAYLVGLPGIGDYTASAICAFAWNLPVPVLDINITRVLRHSFMIGSEESGVSGVGNGGASMARLVRDLAIRCIPDGMSRVWHNALMDYGALVLHSKATGIRSAPQSKFKGSDREVRGRILKELTAGRGVTVEAVKAMFPDKDVDEIVGGLVRDGMVRVEAAEIFFV